MILYDRVTHRYTDRYVVIIYLHGYTAYILSHQSGIILWDKFYSRFSFSKIHHLPKYKQQSYQRMIIIFGISTGRISNQSLNITSLSRISMTPLYDRSISIEVNSICTKFHDEQKVQLQIILQFPSWWYIS